MSISSVAQLVVTPNTMPSASTLFSSLEVFHTAIQHDLLHLTVSLPLNHKIMLREQFLDLALRFYVALGNVSKRVDGVSDEVLGTYD